MRKAIVTLAVGERYKTVFEQYCRDNWQSYCNKFGFELLVLTERLDISKRASARSMSWQKLLILSQDWSSNYDQIVWVDSDIIINSHLAGDITAGLPLECIGGVDQYAIPTREIFDISLGKLYESWRANNVSFLANRSPGTYYTNRGIPGAHLDKVMQGGVFVCAPEFHKDLLEKIYYEYEDESGGGNYENPAMSFEILQAGVIKWLPVIFNFCVINIIPAFYPGVFYKRPSFVQNMYGRMVGKLTGKSNSGKPSRQEAMALKAIYDLSAFMHFASCVDLMPKMKYILDNDKQR
jgi:hypothetical protein